MRVKVYQQALPIHQITGTITSISLTSFIPQQATNTAVLIFCKASRHQLEPIGQHCSTMLIPLSKKSKLETGLKFSRTKSDNDFFFGPMVGGRYKSDANFSNRFIYTENVSAGYINYNNSFGKFDLETGLRGEYSFTEGNSIDLNLVTPRKYFNLFPSLLLNYRYNNKNQFNITFSRE
jgi:hypothetical protein